MNSVINANLREAIKQLLTTGDLPQRVEALNEMRRLIHSHSPLPPVSRVLA